MLTLAAESWQKTLWLVCMVLQCCLVLHHQAYSVSTYALIALIATRMVVAVWMAVDL